MASNDSTPTTRTKKTPKQRATEQVETTGRLIKRAEAKLTKAEKEVTALRDEVADLKVRQAYEKQHPALDPAAQPGAPAPDTGVNAEGETVVPEKEKT